MAARKTSEKAIIQSYGGYTWLILFLAVPVGYLFFSSPYYYNWIIGGIVELLLLLLNMHKAYFFADRIVIKPLPPLPVKTIYYSDVTRMNFTPRFALAASGLGVYCKMNDQEKRKAGFNILPAEFEVLKQIVAASNPKVKFTVWDKRE